MLTHLTENDFHTGSASLLADIFWKSEAELNLSDSVLQYDFPVFRDTGDDELVQAPLLLMSPRHGVVVFETSDANPRTADADLLIADERLESVIFGIKGLCLHNKYLRDREHATKVPITGAIFAPNLSAECRGQLSIESKLLISEHELKAYFIELAVGFKKVTKVEKIDSHLFGELTSTIEGAKALFRPKKRPVSALAADSKGALANLVESELSNFDRDQVRGYQKPVVAAQRIRGLAGSGKTVVLAMKAALLHQKFPDAEIIYTFSTKSLYQHIQKSITRFFEHFGGKEPDWTKLRIMHAWGGETLTGVYSDVCKRHGLQPTNYSRAGFLKQPLQGHFDFVCTQLLKHNLTSLYDYVLVDEGQDFPSSFLQVCNRVARSGKFVLAYDELQNIFNTDVPDPEQILGAGFEFKPDIVLHKCYRNPREILVCAHALGFGIYGPGQPVQMLENEEHWKDIGYEIVQGPLEQGKEVVIERPEKNSLMTISDRNGINEIVQAHVFQDPLAEIDFVAKSIQSDLANGLLPEDILVICASDRSSKEYLARASAMLSELGIQSLVTLSSNIAGKGFQKSGFVTLSTVAMAKGNESFMVYVIGVDSIFNHPSVQGRNIIFTAMTRAKGWIRLTGMGPAAVSCLDELTQAKKHYPNLVFTYPSPDQLRVMKRDLKEAKSPKEKAEQEFEKLIVALGEEKAKQILQQLTYENEKRKIFE